MKAVRFEIVGRVQGVGYRAYVLSLADRHSMVGEVWNCRWGQVAGYAASVAENDLDQFLAGLGRGPGRVDRVLSSREDLEAPPSDFRIGFTR